MFCFQVLAFIFQRQFVSDGHRTYSLSLVHADLHVKCVFNSQYCKELAQKNTNEKKLRKSCQATLRLFFNATSEWKSSTFHAMMLRTLHKGPFWLVNKVNKCPHLVTKLVTMFTPVFIGLVIRRSASPRAYISSVSVTLKLISFDFSWPCNLYSRCFLILNPWLKSEG